MLRLLTLLLYVMAQCTQAAPDSVSVLNDAERMRESMQDQTTRVLQQADELAGSPAFQHELSRESARLTDLSHSQSTTSLPNLPAPDSEQLSRARAEVGKLLDQAAQHDVLGNMNSDRGPRFYVFVSFSMPELTLQRLLQQAARIGAPLVLRGMVENDMNQTRLKIGQLLKADAQGNTHIDGALSIDPTLYERFGISVVPAFVLTQAPVPACTLAGCPTPNFVRLAGDVTLAYVLESIAREVPAMHDDAEALLTTLREETP